MRLNRYYWQFRFIFFRLHFILWKRSLIFTNLFSGASTGMTENKFFRALGGNSKSLDHPGIIAAWGWNL